MGGHLPRPLEVLPQLAVGLLARHLGVVEPQLLEGGPEHLQQVVEVVRHGAGHLAHRLQPLGVLQLVGELPALRHVHLRAHGEPGPAVVPPLHHAAVARDPAPGPVRVPHAVFRLHPRRLAGLMELDGALEGGPVLRMDPRHQPGEGAGDLRHGDAKHRGEARARRDHVAEVVVLPQALVGGLEGAGEALLAGAQRVGGGLELAAALFQPRIPLGERGGEAVERPAEAAHLVLPVRQAGAGGEVPGREARGRGRERRRRPHHQPVREQPGDEPAEHHQQEQHREVQELGAERLREQRRRRHAHPEVAQRGPAIRVGEAGDGVQAVDVVRPVGAEEGLVPGAPREEGGGEGVGARVHAVHPLVVVGPAGEVAALVVLERHRGAGRQAEGRELLRQPAHVDGGADDPHHAAARVGHRRQMQHHVLPRDRPVAQARHGGAARGHDASDRGVREADGGVGAADVADQRAVRFPEPDVAVLRERGLERGEQLAAGGGIGGLEGGHLREAQEQLPGTTLELQHPGTHRLQVHPRRVLPEGLHGGLPLAHPLQAEQERGYGGQHHDGHEPTADGAGRGIGHEDAAICAPRWKGNRCPKGGHLSGGSRGCLTTR